MDQIYLPEVCLAVPKLFVSIGDLMAVLLL